MQTPSLSSAPQLIKVALTGQSPGDSPLTLRIGQQVVVDVLWSDPNTGRALLSLAGRHLEAQVPLGMRGGETARLVVAGVERDRLHLRVVPKPSSALAGSRNTSVALDVAAVLQEVDLPDSAPFRASVLALIESGQPVNRKSVVAVRSVIVAAEGSPEANARAVVRLQHLGIPVTPRSLELARAALPDADGAVRPFAHLLGKLLETIRQELPNGSRPSTAHWAMRLIEHLAPLAGREATPAELRRVVDLIALGPESHVDNVRKGAASSREVSVASTDDPSSDVTTESGDTDAFGIPIRATENARSVLSGAADIVDERISHPTQESEKDTVSLANREGGADQDRPQESQLRVIRQLIQTLHDRIELQQLTNAVATKQNEASLPPDVAPPTDLAGPEGSTPYAEARLSGTPIGASPNGSTTDGQTITLSLPFFLAGGFTTLELTVQRDGSHGPEQEERLQALQFHVRLSLPRLGDVGADLRLVGSNLRCRLRAQSGPAHQLLVKASDGLRDRFTLAGFNIEVLECGMLEHTTAAPTIGAGPRRVNLGV